MNNSDQTPDQTPDQEPIFIPVFDNLPPDPRIVDNEALVYGTLHGLPGYEEEWYRRNPEAFADEEDAKDIENDENFEGYDGNY